MDTASCLRITFITGLLIALAPSIAFSMHQEPDSKGKSGEQVPPSKEPQLDSEQLAGSDKSQTGNRDDGTIETNDEGVEENDDVVKSKPEAQSRVREGDSDNPLEVVSYRQSGASVSQTVLTGITGAASGGDFLTKLTSNQVFTFKLNQFPTHLRMSDQQLGARFRSIDVGKSLAQKADQIVNDPNYREQVERQTNFQSALTNILRLQPVEGYSAKTEVIRKLIHGISEQLIQAAQIFNTVQDLSPHLTVAFNNSQLGHTGVSQTFNLSELAASAHEVTPEETPQEGGATNDEQLTPSVQVDLNTLPPLNQDIITAMQQANSHWLMYYLTQVGDSTQIHIVGISISIPHPPLQEPTVVIQHPWLSTYTLDSSNAFSILLADIGALNRMNGIMALIAMLAGSQQFGLVQIVISEDQIETAWQEIRQTFFIPPDSHGNFTE
ncbi:hypothetical protein EOPP23_13680 [Endozoicomonas sp. OPT23]|uniref:hypothetical protein n=1 Tax=Endozoicomonas sp. OPT23 TaxID=2072845 RepID=UPI00129A4838|nr:hypothetical protein [Endozoicomonas sp. OPT23]MRI34042.1 hypothetical protein [Endozoicomonas sp. OPT23]